MNVKQLIVALVTLGSIATHYALPSLFEVKQIALNVLFSLLNITIF